MSDPEDNRSAVFTLHDAHLEVVLEGDTVWLKQFKGSEKQQDILLTVRQLRAVFAVTKKANEYVSSSRFTDERNIP